MFLELIAAITAGVLAGGIVLILNRLSRGRLPRWLMPLVAGLAMIAFSIRMEYTWFDRTMGTLPEGVELVATHEARQVWRPWTFVWPVTDRFAAIDMVSVQNNANHPELVMANVLFFGRWAAPEIAPMLHDCDRRLAAPLLDTVVFAEDGAVLEAAWAAIAENDPTLELLCKED